MKQRKWDPKAKAKIVLEGITSRPFAEIRNEHQICQSQYYQWRDQFLSNLDRVFDAPQKASRETRLESKIKNFRALIGELTLELKKQKSCSYENIIHKNRHKKRVHFKKNRDPKD